jgi:hypothetical protein
MKAPENDNSFVLAALAGIGLWGIASLIISKREPWDDSLYWLVIYPLAIVASALLAYRFPHRAKLLALVIFESQFVAMALRNREVGNLWPLGMALFAVIAIPAVFVAKVAASHSPFIAGPSDSA